MSNPTDQPLTPPITARQIVRDICNRRRNSDIRADDKELEAAINNAISGERIALERERAAHAETRERLTRMEILHRRTDESRVWHYQKAEEARKELAEAQKDTEHVMTCRELQCGICGRIEAALRAKPEPNALRPAESEASDTTSLQGGKPNE